MLAVGTAGAAIILSIVSIGISLASITTTVVLWRRSGARVKVTSATAYMVFGSDMDSENPRISVEAANIGRAPVSVTGWGFQLPGNATLVNLRPEAYQPTLPHRLEPGSSATWYMHARGVTEQLAERRVNPASVRAFVQLGTGAKTLAKKAPPL